MLRVTTLVELNNGNWSFEIFSTCLNELYKIATPISFTTNNVVKSLGVAFFVLMLSEPYKMQNKKLKPNRSWMHLRKVAKACTN